MESREPATIDRISSLPDEIISHVLSFLPAKYAVATAALSRRWKDLSTSLRDLDFDNRLVRSNPLETREFKRRDLEFSRFVVKVLRQHKNLNSVRRFRFQFSVDYYDCELSRDVWCPWMESASDESQLEEIDIRLKSVYDVGPICELWSPPVSFFTLKNLKVLKLTGIIIGVMPASICLSSLKILQLLKVRTKDFELLTRLISGCPVLETLHLENCCFKIWNFDQVLIASLPSLKNLTVINNDGWLLCSIEMEAPNLEHLYLLKFGELQFMGSSSPLSCIHSAWVDTPVYEKTLVDDDGVKYRHHDGPRRIGLLTQISNAKEMLLSWQTLNFLTFVNDNVPVQPLLPVFRDLTHFTVRPSENSSRYSDTKLARSSYVLHSLLNSASKLQRLVIDMGNRRIRMEWEDAEELACIPECMLSSLEEIEIQNLKADEDERKMVAYLLKAGAVLKKVSLHLFEDVVDYDLGDMEDRLELASLLKLPRGSSTCEAHLLLTNGDEIHIDSNM